MARAERASARRGPGRAKDELSLVTDVLVLGGGPAGAWAAIAARAAGAEVVLADKGFFGTSGLNLLNCRIQALQFHTGVC